MFKSLISSNIDNQKVYYPEPIQPKYFPHPRSIKYLPPGEKKCREYSHEEFEAMTTIKYLHHLEFDSKETCERLKKLCSDGVAKGTIKKRAEWLGLRYRREVLWGEVADVVIQWVNDRMGFGLFANDDIKRLDYIGEYVGVVRPCTYFFANVNTYCFRYPLYRIGYYIYTIDAQDRCNETSFINHSNFPNSESIVTINNDLLHVGIRASRDIVKGEQITYDYGNNMWSGGLLSD